MRRVIAISSRLRVRRTSAANRRSGSDALGPPGFLGPYGPGIDNLLSMFLRRYFEGLQQLADFVLDGLIMILQRAAILEGERGIGFGLTRLGQNRFEHLLTHDSHRGHRPKTRLRGRVTPRLLHTLHQPLGPQLLQVVRRLSWTVLRLALTRQIPNLGRQLSG